jgi:hypothetical protein
MLDLLTETDILDYKRAVSSIDVKVKISANVRKHIDRKSYQRFVGGLIYLYHIHFNISFIASAMNCYMHDS